MHNKINEKKNTKTIKSIKIQAHILSLTLTTAKKLR